MHASGGAGKWRGEEREGERASDENLGRDRSNTGLEHRRLGCGEDRRLDGGLDSERYERVYRKFEPFLRSLAAKTYRKYRYKITSYDDLYQTLVYLLFYSIDIYDPSRGSLPAHIKRTVNYKLKSMLSGEYAPKSKESPFTFLRMIYTLAEPD